MTAQDFFYWLQGFIELSTAAAFKFMIGPDVARCILAHVDLIPEDERGAGVIEVRTLVRLASKATSEDIARDLTREIAEAVASVFKHVIDPKAGDADEQARLNAIHEQNPHLRPRPYTGSPVIRC